MKRSVSDSPTITVNLESNIAFSSCVVQLDYHHVDDGVKDGRMIVEYEFEPGVTSVRHKLRGRDTSWYFLDAHVTLRIDHKEHHYDYKTVRIAELYKIVDHVDLSVSEGKSHPIVLVNDEACDEYRIGISWSSLFEPIARAVVRAYGKIDT